MQPETVETSFRTGRVLISLLVWLLCAPGIFFHCAFAIIAGGSLLTGQHLSPFDASEVLAGVFGVITLFAWVALGWMDYRWMEDRTFHWAWPAFGTLLALVAAVHPHPGIDLRWPRHSDGDLPVHLAHPSGTTGRGSGGWMTGWPVGSHDSRPPITSIGAFGAWTLPEKRFNQRSCLPERGTAIGGRLSTVNCRLSCDPTASHCRGNGTITNTSPLHTSTSRYTA